jgi:hypothetical protein
MIIYYEPNSVIKIEIFENYLDPDIFPVGLTDIIFGPYFNVKIKENILPITLNKIIFGKNFNQIIEPNVIPPNVKFLQFDFGFKQKIIPNSLPNELTHLIFIGGYAHPLEKFTLPPNLLHLFFYYNKYEIQSNILPNTITHLKLGYGYNFKFTPNMLPHNLSYLDFDKTYSRELVNLPTNIKTICIDGHINNLNIINSLPNNLIFLIIDNLNFNIDNLPMGINIKLLNYNDQTLEFFKKIPWETKIYDKNNNLIKIK